MKQETYEKRTGSVAWSVSAMFYLYTERGNEREWEKGEREGEFIEADRDGRKFWETNGRKNKIWI